MIKICLMTNLHVKIMPLMIMRNVVNPVATMLVSQSVLTNILTPNNGALVPVIAQVSLSDIECKINEEG